MILYLVFNILDGNPDKFWKKKWKRKSTLDVVLPVFLLKLKLLLANVVNYHVSAQISSETFCRQSKQQ